MNDLSAGERRDEPWRDGLGRMTRQPANRAQSSALQTGLFAHK
jgi:hypothetical protein